MAFFDDLSECSYFQDLSLPALVAVGWLERGRPYSRGDAGSEVRRRLKEFRDARWHLTAYLGGHYCDLCTENESLHWSTDDAYSKTDLFIPGEGVIYAAPEGICHYVTEHSYHPPNVFCEAVLTAPAADSIGYFEALRKCGFPRRWLGLRRTDPSRRHPRDG